MRFMQWSLQHQILYASLILFGLVLIAAGGWFLFFYTPDSCSDGAQNQNEEGIDCGGVCALLCEAPNVSATWARSVRVAPGVYHAVAMVRNSDAGAGTTNLPYTFSLYDADNLLIATKKGLATLEPGEVVPIFEKNVITGERVPVRTFIDFEGGTWFKMERIESPIRITSQSLDQNNLRLTASVENKTPSAVENIILTALLYDADDVLVAASQTVINTLQARGTQTVTFTWQEAFERPVVRTDIVPRVER